MELNATFFLQLVLFFALLAWLSPMLFEPFMRLFEERERRITGAADEAKKLAGHADEAAAKIAERTQAAQLEARSVLNDLRARALVREGEIIGAAREKASTRLDEARADLFEATEETRRALRDEAKKLAGEIVEKVLGRAA